MDKKAFQILLAEDKPADMAIIREALKHRHVECDFQILCDGGKALAVIDRLDAEFEATTLDLLIVDMHLPRHDGDAMSEPIASNPRWPPSSGRRHVGAIRSTLRGPRRACVLFKALHR